jgi:hypothetical protein
LPHSNALPGAGILVLVNPAEEAIEQILDVEIAIMKQAVSKAQRHRGIVSPRPGWQFEIAPGQHLPDLKEAASILELYRRPQGVADCEANQGTAGTFLNGSIENSINHRLPLRCRMA